MPRVVIHLSTWKKHLLILLTLIVLIHTCFKAPPASQLAQRTQQSTPLQSSQQRTDSHPQKPHIILILADDLGWNDVSWHNPHVLTPHLESLAKDGILLEQSYVQPICTPTRAALLTGRYPYTIGSQHSVIWPLQPVGLSLNVTIMPQSFKAAGYDTHIVGKWHLGFCSWAHTPTKRGFDTFYGFYNDYENYYYHYRLPGGTGTQRVPKDLGLKIPFGYDFWNDTEPDLSVMGTYSTYLSASYVEKLLSSRKASDPMFLYLPFQSVHGPLQAPLNYANLYEKINSEHRRVKLGMVTAMDEAVGRVVSALKRTGHYNNSIIVFLSDNGAQYNHFGSNWPLRGEKWTLWEGGTRSPTFIHSPLLNKSGFVSNQLFHVTDWFPTLVGRAGGKVPTDIDGVDQWDALTGSSQQHPRDRMVYSIDNANQLWAGLRIGSYKLLVGDPGSAEQKPPAEGGQFVMPTNEYEEKLQKEPLEEDDADQQLKQSNSFNLTNIKLYNVVEDPGEHHNLADKHPEKVFALLRYLDQELPRVVPVEKKPYCTDGYPAKWHNIWTPGWCHPAKCYGPYCTLV